MDGWMDAIGKRSQGIVGESNANSHHPHIRHTLRSFHGYEIPNVSHSSRYITSQFSQL